MLKMKSQGVLVAWSGQRLLREVEGFASCFNLEISNLFPMLDCFQDEKRFPLNTVCSKFKPLVSHLPTLHNYKKPGSLLFITFITCWRAVVRFLGSLLPPGSTSPLPSAVLHMTCAKATNHFCVPPLNLIQFVDVFPEVGDPKLDAVI